MIPFLSLFRELAPRLAGLRLTDHPSVRRGDASVNSADATRLREISPTDLAKFKELPLILDVREQNESSVGTSKGRKISVEVRLKRRFPK